nr:sel1 repeat family protein [uncultured Pseudomonas sp.]
MKLREAAGTGDKEAQFYLAETLKLLSGHMTPESKMWYEKSARQGDMYSMYRLSSLKYDLCSIMQNCPASPSQSRTWGENLYDVAIEKANQGDGEGMEMMYTLTGDLDWLVKSADSGYASAQNWLAVRYEWGDGWFIWPGQRNKEIDRLYKASAEGGYPRAMSQYAGILLLQGDVTGAQKWLMKTVAVGYIPAVATYASVLVDGKYYHLEKDLQMAYSLNLVLAEIDDGATHISTSALSKLKLQLTVEQIAAATLQAEAWKAAHPPLSYYPPKLVFF